MAGWVSCVIFLWLLVSAAAMCLISFFTKQLFDPFYPVLIGSNPGILMASIGLSLAVTVAVVALAHFRIALDSGPLPAMIQAFGAFMFVVCSLSYCVNYGSTFMKEDHAKRLAEALNQCPMIPMACERFRQAVGGVDAQQAEHIAAIGRYVDARTVKITLPLSGSLIIWLILHSWVVYFVFGRQLPGKRAKLNDQTLVAEELALESESS
jgi:hypothetical protein